MSRIKIKFPEQNALFTTTIPVRIGDLNYGAHVGNDAVLSIIHESRVQWLKKHNYTELNVAGVGLIMADSAIVYKGEGFYGDVFEIEIFVDDLTNVSFDLLYKIQTEKDGKAIAVAKTGMVCFDYDSRKVTAMPDELKRVLTTV